MTRAPVFRLAHRLIGFRAGLSLLGYQQGRTKKGQSGALAPSRPALLYSRSMTLESLLSVALSFIGQSRFYHPLLAEDKNGLLFDSKVVPFLMIILMSQLSKWVLFR